MTKNNIHHVPVLLNEVVQAVPENAKIIADGTLGYGGHCKKILETYPTIQKYYGFDIDPSIFAKTTKKLQEEDIENTLDITERFEGHNSSYTTIADFFSNKNTEEKNIKKNPDFVLLDL